MSRFVRSLCLLLLVLPAVWIEPAEAHRFAPSLLRLFETEQGEFNVIWKTPAKRSSSVALRPVFPEGCAVVGGENGELEGTGVVLNLQLACSSELIGSEFSFTGLAENQASVLLSLERLDGSFYQSLLNADTPVFEVPAEPTAWRVMQEYSALGAEHIWGGIDHLLFVFGLLLLVGGGRRLIWTITAFTLGHSVTLCLVTLGYFEYPVAWVEFAIAVSIFVLAIDLARPDAQGLFRRYPWWLAGGFGLLHGMGFAGALAEVGLPQQELPLALLFFNLGIEFGQLAFIGLIIVLAVVLRRLLQAMVSGFEVAQLRLLPVYLLGGLSAMWCIERGLEALA